VLDFGTRLLIDSVPLSAQSGSFNNFHMVFIAGQSSHREVRNSGPAGRA